MIIFPWLSIFRESKRATGEEKRCSKKGSDMMREDSSDG
jgi:hypothetical protein